MRGPPDFTSSYTLFPYTTVVRALDARMVAVARGIKVLTLVSWPASVQQRFLEGHARGHDVPPRIQYPRHDFGDARRELDAIAAAADPAHPLGAYLVEFTRRWSTATTLDRKSTRLNSSH